MITVPIFFDVRPEYSGATFLNISYSYIPDSGLSINGAGDQSLARVNYSFTGAAGDYVTTHGDLTLDATPPVLASGGGLLRNVTHPDSWLELIIEIDYWDGSYRYNGRLSGPILNPYPSLILPPIGNYYTVPAPNTYLFQSFTTMAGTGDIDPWHEVETYWDSFSPFTFHYLYGDGTEETFTVTATWELGTGGSGTSGLTRLVCSHTIPTPKVYAAGEHIDYPKLWITNAYGQRMRPVYYDLYPTADVVVDAADLRVQFDLTIWDFENEFDSYDIGFGDGTYLLNQTATSLTHNYPAPDVDYHVQFDLRDRDTPGAYTYINHVLLTVRPSIDQFDALITRAGPILTACPVDGNVQIYYSAGGTADRVARALVTGASAPSLSQDATGRVRMMVHADDEWAMYESADEGETMVAL